MDVSGWGPVAPFVRLVSQERPLAWRLAFAVLVIGAAYALRYISAVALQSYAPYIFQLPAVLIVALVGGFRVGLFAVALSVAGNATFVPAEAWRGTAGATPLVSLSSFTLNCLAVCIIAAMLRTSVLRLQNARASLAVAAGEKEATLATLESLLSHAPLGFAFFDRQQRFVRVNSALARMNGIPVEEHLGRSMADLLPHFAEAAGAHIRRVFERGDVITDVESEGTTPAQPGVWRHWLTSYFPVRDTAGNIRFVGITVVEITERKKVEHDLLASERRYRLLAEALPKMVWTANPQGKGDYYNRRWQEYTGVPSEGGDIVEWHTFLHPDERDEVYKAWEHSIGSGEPFNRECRFRAADGTFRWFLCRAVPVLDDDGRIDRWYGSCTDIGEIVAAREALARSHDELERLVAQRTAELGEANARLKVEMEERSRAESQLRQAQKMEAVGQLTGGIAHDFNNLLTVIIGNLEAAERRVGPEETEIRTFLDHSRQGAMRAATLTQRLLAFSRRQPLDPKPTDVNRLVVGMSQMLRSALGERVPVETVLSGGLWWTEVDQNQLENAVLNLAVNARDAMPDGGKLTIETANAYLDEAYARDHDDVEAGQYVVICVSDTGTGMDEEVMARVFEPFFSTKGPREGTGLGLSQVYGFVKQSGGHVKIYSEIGEGTTVKIYLPRFDQVQQAEPQAHKPVPLGGRIAEVLVVEDDPQVRRLGVAALKEAGHNVIEAGNAQDAMALLENGARPDLLFTDMRLGNGLDGRALADKARAILPHLRVLFTTGYARNAIVHHGRLERGVNLLTKPFTQLELAQKVKDILDDPVAERGTVLLVEDEPFVALVARQIMEDHGFKVTVASHGAAALTHARAAAEMPERDAFVLAVVDLGLPDMRGDQVVRELRTIAPTLSIVIATGYDTEELQAEFGGEAGIALVNKPYDGATLRNVLRGLGFDVSD